MEAAAPYVEAKLTDAAYEITAKVTASRRAGSWHAGRNDRDSPRGRAPKNDGQGDKDFQKRLPATLKKRTKKVVTKENPAVKRGGVCKT